MERYKSLKEFSDEELDKAIEVLAKEKDDRRINRWNTLVRYACDTLNRIKHEFLGSYFQTDWWVAEIDASETVDVFETVCDITPDMFGVYGGLK